MAGELDELLARLRAATGAAYVLDVEIARVVGLGPRIVPRPYTGSLDAALTLVPSDAMLVALSDIAADGLPGACLCTDTSTSPPVQHWGVTASRGPERFALALCIAALEARRAGGAR